MPLASRLLPLLLGSLLALGGPHGAHAQRRGLGGLAEEFGDSGTCADRARTFSRLMNRPRTAFIFGPAPDREDIAYGNAPRERLDVFLSKRRDPAAPAPVIVMVHGGGWCVGDKALSGVTKNKVDHWVPLGFVFVSVNYPMLPDGSAALQQAAAVARAVAYVQKHAGEWGGDGKRVVLMGHSAGAHLVSLVNADARLRAQYDVKPVLGTVSLDSGATDVVEQLRKSMPRMHGRFEEAFGATEDGWIKSSPFHQLDATASPWLGVCSTARADDPCSQARAYADKSLKLGIKATVVPLDKPHGAINKDLGSPGAYTNAVDEFLASLDPGIRTLLAR